MRWTTTDPRSSGFADTVGAVINYVSSGSFVTLVKTASGSTDWAEVQAVLPAAPMTRCPTVLSDPRTAGRAGQVDEVVLYYTGGAGTYLIKYGTGNTDWVKLPTAGDFVTSSSGSGTTGRLAKWTAANVLGDSSITDTGTFVGIGASSPGYPLVVSGVGAVFGGQSVTNSALVNEFRKDASNNLSVSAYGTSVEPQILMLHGRGTGASPSALGSGESLGLWSFTGATGATTIFGGALIRALTTETWGANVGAKLEFSTTKNGAGTGGRAVRLTIDHDGSTTFARSAASGGSITLTNTDTTGQSELQAADNAGTFKVALGYGNSSFSDSSRTSRGYLWRATGVNFAIGRSGAVIDAMIFSNGNFNLGTSTSDPGVKLQVEGTTKVTGVATFADEVRLGSATGPLVKSGTGSPEGVVTAPVGSLWTRTDGGAGTTLYVKESGSGNTGWAAK